MIFVYHVQKENLHCGKFIEPRFKMKMEIIESDLKQIFQWLQLLNNKVDDLDKRIIKIEVVMPHIVEMLTQEDNK